MTLALFDLDNTLIADDSDHLWGEFIIEQGVVEAQHYREQNDRFYQDYQRGKLDIQAYLEFALAPLARFTMAELASLHQQFMEQKIKPVLLPKAKELIEHHRQQGHRLVVITATNHFITQPIVSHLGIEELLASEPEIINNRYTGKVTGTPCYQHGKVTRLFNWLKEQELSLEDSWFYSDSANDIPLLSEVTHPVAVDPDDRLAAYALANRIPVISLR